MWVSSSLTLGPSRCRLGKTWPLRELDLDDFDLVASGLGGNQVRSKMPFACAAVEIPRADLEDQVYAAMVIGFDPFLS